MGLKNYQAPILTLAARYLAKHYTYLQFWKDCGYDRHNGRSAWEWKSL